jgi:DNA polymerase-3 subunit delta'
MFTVTGQERITSLLARALAAGTLPHALLLTGPPGVGKATLALQLAQAINCTGPDAPCGECLSCRRIAEGKHPDVRTIALNPRLDLEAMADPRDKISTDAIKDLQYAAALPPFMGRKKVFIVDGAEYMTGEASNRLLKTLEEPLPQVMWLLVSPEPRRLLPTILSRCQRLDLRPVPAPALERWLIEEHKLDAATAALYARISGGCPGWALNVIADDTLLDKRAVALEKFFEMLSNRLDLRFNYAEELGRTAERDKPSAQAQLRLWAGLFRDVLMLQYGVRDALTNLDQEAALTRLAGLLTPAQARDAVRRIEETAWAIERNASARLAYEVLMLGLPAVPAPAPAVAVGA